MRANRHQACAQGNSFKRVDSILLFGALMLGAVYPISVVAQASDLPEGEGRSLVVENCAACHDLALVTATRRTPEDWDATVNRMIANGITLDESQYDQILAYLKGNLAAETAAGTPSAGNDLAQVSDPNTPLK